MREGRGCKDGLRFFFFVFVRGDGDVWYGEVESSSKVWKGGRKRKSEDMRKLS